MKRYITITIIFLLSLSAFIFINEKLERPTIYIIREYPAESLQGPATVIDYTINGYACSMVFYDYELGRYDAFIAQLEKEGRVVR